MLHTLLLCVITLAPADPAKLAGVYTDAVHDVNEKHARDPGKNVEADLAKKLPAPAVKALDQLLAEKPSPGLTNALAACSEAALDLDRIDDFNRIRARRAKDSPADAALLDTALSRPRVVLRGVGGLDEDYLAHFADVVEGVLAAYDEVFGFAEFSKVPGKKLRVRVRLVDKITAPPHFGPEFPYHSEIDFPVVDAHEFKSPTAEAQFLFYGLCHELGHVIAMWDTEAKKEDYHAWAHYCGVTIVEHIAQAKDPPQWLKNVRDARWRSLEKEREAAKDVKPGLDSNAAVMATLIQLHDRVGPRDIAAAIDRMDAKNECRRVNRVRYYTFEGLRKALLAVVGKDAAKRAAADELL